MNQDSEMKEEDDSFSNSVEDSSSDEDVDDEKIAELKDQIQYDPYVYERHVQLITLCRKLGNLEELRSAREKMSKMFPLSPELWLDWLSDEKTLATTQEQKDSLVALFERAIKDYSSVSVWLEYVLFSIGNIGESWDKEGLAVIRQTFEQAVTSVGIHVTQGCLIWEAYRQFESDYLEVLKKKMASEKELKEQEDRVFNIFKRQLTIPLLDMDKTYEEFKEQFSDTSDKNTEAIEYSYKKALKKLNQIKVYENDLYVSESPHYAEYKAYIAFEKKDGDPIRVQSIYERALIENCLKEELWLDYSKYLDREVKISCISLPLHERAVRNLPWSSQLWVRYVRALEFYEEPHEKVKGIFESVLMSGFVESDVFKDLWLAYLDYLRRRINADDLESGEHDFKEIETVFTNALTQMTQYFWGSEAEYIIMKYWIFFNAKYKKDLETARECWKEVIDHGHKEEARVWLEYANFERVYGDAKHYRKTLLQALSCVSDWPDTFLELIITFEREEGTLESLEKSLAKCETLMQHIKEKRQKRLAEAASSLEKEDKRRHPSRRGAKNSKNDSPSKSDPKLPIQMDSEGFKIPPPPMKMHLPENSSKQDPLSNSESSKKRKSMDDEDLSEPKKRKVEVSDSHGVSVTHDSSKDDRTVFVSNLSFQVEEDKLKEFFSQIGEVEDVRLVKDFKGRSKGFCYVLYKTQAEARSALSRDREPLDGRPVFISSCEDKKKNPSFQPKFKFGTGLERNKLFIKNLPFATTKEDLENMYKEYGCLKEVRIVTYRNGHSKGLAYVEFKDEAAAANAVVKTDGTQIMDHVISVAISNPPPRREKSKFSSASISESLGGGGGLAKGPRGRGRTQLALVPRAVARPASRKNILSKSSMQNGQNSSSSSSAESKPLSNSDFANMLKK